MNDHFNTDKKTLWSRHKSKFKHAQWCFWREGSKIRSKAHKISNCACAYFTLLLCLLHKYESGFCRDVDISHLRSVFFIKITPSLLLIFSAIEHWQVRYTMKRN